MCGLIQAVRSYVDALLSESVASIYDGMLAFGCVGWTGARAPFWVDYSNYLLYVRGNDVLCLSDRTDPGC